MYSVPPGFRNINGRLDDNLTKPPQKVFSSAISVTDLEKQMVLFIVILFLKNVVLFINRIALLISTNWLNYSPQII